MILFFIIFVGILSGIFTGLFPGIHINMISNLLLVNISILLIYVKQDYLVIYIIVMGIVHSFIDFIPSVLFGVADADTNISILPIHRLVNLGRAYEAIFYSSIGSLFGMFISFLIIPFFYILLNYFYIYISNFIPFFLISVVLILIFIEKKIKQIYFSIIIILFSSSLGFLILNSDLINSPLLIIFSGIFGIASLFSSLFNDSLKNINQTFEIDFKFNLNFLKAILIGSSSASICSISPGLGNSQAMAISTIFFKDLNSKLFIVTTSTINTVNFILSFLTFYLIEKSRNGSVIVISQIISKLSLNQIKFYFLIIFIVSIISFFLTLFLGKKLILFFFNLNLFYTNLILILILSFLILFLEGWVGLLMLILSSILGLLTILLEVKRVHLLSVLLIPVIFNLFF